MDFEQRGNFIADLFDAADGIPGFVACLGIAESTTVQGACGTREVFDAWLAALAQQHPEHRHDAINPDIVWAQDWALGQLSSLMLSEED